MGSDRPSDGDSLEWRVELLDKLLRWSLALGLLGLTISAPALVDDGLPGLVAVDAVVLGTLVALIVMRSSPYRYRVIAYLVLVAVTGTSVLLFVGIAGQLFLVGVPVLATVLLGQRVSHLALAAALLLFGAGSWVSAETIGLSNESNVVAWTASLVNFVLVAALLTYAAGHLIARLERSLAAQQRAAREAARLAAAVEQSVDSVLLVDGDGLVVHVNPAHRRLVGRLGAEARIVALEQLAERIELWSQRPGRDGSGMLAEWAGVAVLRDSEGVEHRFDVRSSPLRDGSGSVVGAAVGMHDISERTRIEEHLRRGERLESLGTFASGVAHDFNNVLAGVRLLAESIGENSDDPEIIENVSTIIGACDRVGVTVQQIMVFGRQDTPQRRPIVLAEAIADALVLVRAALPPGVDLVADLADDSVVVANPAEIQQIVMNLATNAVHAMTVAGRARGVLALEMRRVVLADGPLAVEMVVTDTGTGIDPAHLTRLFDPFFTTKAPGEGSGMGLASVHGIVAALGGTIAVASEIGRGTEFRIRLPLSVDGSAPASGSDWAMPQSVEVAIGRRDDAPDVSAVSLLRILLVDDEAPIRAAVAKFLGRHGHDVTTASDGAEALEVFTADPDRFDLLITDVTMPRLDGPSLIRRVRELRPGLAVLVSTGYGESERRFGDTVPVLVKPYSFADLDRAIAQLHVRPGAGDR